jgi:hypothetical protein
MTPREERGLIIAATCRLNRLPDGTWLVPSQTKRSETAAYRVNLEQKTCACPDHVETGRPCKHCYAAMIVHKRDVLPDGTVIETETITLTTKKVYKQDWPAYNKAQATESGDSAFSSTIFVEVCRTANASKAFKGGKKHCPGMPFSRWPSRSTADTTLVASARTWTKRTRWVF